MFSAVDLEASASEYWKEHVLELPTYFGIGVRHYNQRNEPQNLQPLFSAACSGLSQDDWTVLYIIHDVMSSAEEVDFTKYKLILDKAFIFFDSDCLRNLKSAWSKCKAGDARSMRVQILFVTQRDSARPSPHVTKRANPGRADSPRYVCRQ